MKERIDEMAKVLVDYTKKNHIMASHVILKDYAEQLYNAGYRKQEWISVDERLPNPQEYDWVLVNIAFNEDGTYGVPQVAEYRNGEWWNTHDRLTDLYITVTHWMPLPEPPEMKGGE